MAKEGHHFVDSQRVAREKLKKEYVSKKWHGGKGSNQRPGDTQAVSYTHLTLPPKA